MDFDMLRSLAPEDVREQLDTLWEQTGGNASPLQLCIAGAFSTGKTTLLNNLLGSGLLPVALEETTALPTFVEFSDSPRYDLVLVEDENVEAVHLDDLREIVTNPPESARLVSVGLPLPWLKGVSIIDLPGTGSMAERNREYSREQLRQADAVIYLLANRGASKEDVANLAMLHMLGKKVFLGVAKWDVVQGAVDLGEKKPDLAVWASGIAYETGLECPLHPLDHTGLGKDKVLDFIQEAKQALHDVRLRRFAAEARPILESRLGQCQEAAAVLAADSEEALRQKHGELLQEKQALHEIRQQADIRRTEETRTILEKWDKGCEEFDIQLQEGLRDSAAQWVDREGEDAFWERGETLLRDTLTQAAALGHALSQQYGDLQIPPVELHRRHLHLAPPPPVDAADFLDVGRLELLESRLKNLQHKQRDAEQQPEYAPGEIRAEIAAQEQSITELEKMRRSVLSKPLPKIQQTDAGNGNGRMLGRAIGEIADLALLFFLPVTAGSKVGGIIGKAGKAIGMSAKTAKAMGTTARTVTTVALNLNRAGQSANIVQPKRGGGRIPKGVLEKIGKLEMLTLGYWGERIGTAIDGEPITSTYTDPEAIREQQENLAAIDAELREHRDRLFILERKLKTPGTDKAALESQMASVRAELQALTAKAEQKKAEVETARLQEFQSMLAYEKNRCSKEWLNVFSHHCQSMRRLLDKMLQHWWEEYLPTLLKDNESRVDALIGQMKALPTQRKEKEDNLRDMALKLQQALDCLGK